MQQRNLGQDDAEAIRNLRRRARALEVVVYETPASDQEKTAAWQELRDIDEFLRKSPWRSQDNAQKCLRAVARAIQRLHRHLAKAVDTDGQPHPVLQDFARHVQRYLLFPSRRGGRPGGVRAASVLGGCFTYEPPPGVAWI